MVGELKLVGLTGGIGSGKSTVARFIAALGVPVIDADQVARWIMVPGEPAHADITRAFPDVLAADGTIDRKRLATHVFTDPAARLRLEAITHPRIAERVWQEAQALADAGHRLAVYEASLLVETGRYTEFDGLIVVTASPEQQIARATARDGAPREEVEGRMRAQLPLEDKLRVATEVIDNDGDLAATRRQVETLVAKLRGPVDR
jgi:dephospho-CoA kinase